MHKGSSHVLRLSGHLHPIKALVYFNFLFSSPTLILAFLFFFLNIFLFWWILADIRFFILLPKEIYNEEDSFFKVQLKHTDTGTPRYRYRYRYRYRCRYRFSFLTGIFSLIWLWNLYILQRRNLSLHNILVFDLLYVSINNYQNSFAAI